MTFSIVARCERTGMLGAATSTRAYAGGARNPHVLANVGALVSQATSNPRLGRLALHLLEHSYSAPSALAQVAATDPHIEYRQLGIVDRDGNSAARTGSENHEWAGHITEKNFVALGNHLVGPRTIEAMAESFRATEDLELDERLVRAIEAGRDAGGQHGGQRSSALLVFDREVFPWIHLRVDAHEEPIGEMRRIFELCKNSKEFFKVRAVDPKRAAPLAPRD